MPAILHVFSVALAAAALASSPTGAKASPEGSGLPWGKRGPSLFPVRGITLSPGDQASESFQTQQASLTSPQPSSAAVAGLPGQNLGVSWQDDEGIARFLYDVQKIQSHVNTTLTTPCYVIMRDSSYTRNWRLDDWDRHTQHPLRRYWRHVKSWPKSTTSKHIMPFVFVLTLWSTAVVAVATRYPSIMGNLRTASIKTGLLAGLASPIALLLTLKTNRALDRLFEARRAWGQLTRALRALTGMFCAYVAPSNGPLALLCARYLAIFPWCLRGRLRGEADEEVIRAVLPPEEAAWLLAAPCERPIAILSRIRALMHHTMVGTEVSLPVPISVHNAMCYRLWDLETSVGVCNRILGSPIPPTFTRLTSRLLCMYLVFLPIGLLGNGVSPLSAVFTTFLTAYIFCGIDEIGVELEHPFPLLPLFGLCTLAQKGVTSQVTMMRSMPNV